MQPRPERDLEPTPAYRLPPAPIPEILLAPPLPAVAVSPTREWLALLDREGLPPIAELAAPELRLAGVRIDPRTDGPSRESYYTGITLQRVDDPEPRRVTLPAGARLSWPRWSPDGRRLAVVSTTAEGLALWLVEVSTGAARRFTDFPLNAALGAPYAWLPDGSGVVVRRTPPGRGAPPAPPLVPAGPRVRESRGVPAPARTYQDLLASDHDEALFEYHCRTELVRVPLDGAPVVLGEPALYSDFGPAPGAGLLLVERIVRPYSHLVPWHRFAAEVEVWDLDGRRVREIASLPLAEEVPIAFDAVPAGPRRFQWRADAPATLAWVEALDGGDPRREAEARDRVFLWDAPFDAPPRPLITLEQRFAGILWGTGERALVYSRWWNTRRVRTYVVGPDAPDAAPRLLWDRSHEDRYGDPGTPLTRRNAAGQTVLQLATDGASVFLAGEGASPRGDYPFLDRLDLDTAVTERLWQAEDPHYEAVVALLDAEGRRVLTRRESHTETPNFFARDLETGELRALTRFEDPAPQLAGIQRRIITYPRADGVRLSATLYTPAGYDAERDGPLPLLMWAYPREFLDPEAASQMDDSPNRFSRPGGASPLLLLTQGYAILDGPAMPIVSAAGEEPNDRYIEELVMGAEAAVDAVVALGVAERDRIAVGGHSYGGAMTANLLAHSDLFRAGIARSGAYNRTLTPFGFQAEQRTYWDAPEVYHRMSPFSYADRITRPLLLIHGEADNNPGTHPLQSERFYHALKGHGATVRYVVLPHESHGYRARESVLHCLAEMVEWLDTYLGKR